MYRIFIIEDDPTIAGLIEKNLVKWGYEAKHAGDFKDIAGEAEEYSPHRVLLDIKLPTSTASTGAAR